MGAVEVFVLFTAVAVLAQFYFPVNSDIENS